MWALWRLVQKGIWVHALRISEATGGLSAGPWSWDDLYYVMSAPEMDSFQYCALALPPVQSLPWPSSQAACTSVSCLGQPPHSIPPTHGEAWCLLRALLPSNTRLPLQAPPVTLLPSSLPCLSHPTAWSWAFVLLTLKFTCCLPGCAVNSSSCLSSCLLQASSLEYAQRQSFLL